MLKITLFFYKAVLRALAPRRKSILHFITNRSLSQQVCVMRHAGASCSRRVIYVIVKSVGVRPFNNKTTRKHNEAIPLTDCPYGFSRRLTYPHLSANNTLCETHLARSPYTSSRVCCTIIRMFTLRAAAGYFRSMLSPLILFCPSRSLSETRAFRKEILAG